MRGDRRGAITALRKAIDDGWRLFWWAMPRSWLLREDGLLDDPEFIALFDELKADIAEQRRWYQENKDKPLF